MYKERVEAMMEDNRKLRSEALIINNNLDNQRGLIELFEKEKRRLEREL